MSNKPISGARVATSYVSLVSGQRKVELAFIMFDFYDQMGPGIRVNQK